MPPKLETQKYTVLNARRIAGKRREVDDVVDLAPGTADHLVASGDVEPVADTPARKKREAEAAIAAKAPAVTGFEMSTSTTGGASTGAAPAGPAETSSPSAPVAPEVPAEPAPGVPAATPAAELPAASTPELKA